MENITSENLKFSILVPVYNSENYLHSCIESVLNQAYDNFELVLVDDGSKDSSGLLCDEYEKKDSRVRAFHKENGGPLSTRLFAIEQARGDFLVFLDSDDYLTPDALEVLNKTILEEHCDCVIFGYQKVYEGKILRKVCDDKKLSAEGQKDVMIKTCFTSRYGSMCTKCIKRTAAVGKDISQYGKLAMGEDYLQSLHIMKDCEKVTFIPDVLYNYTVNPNSLTQHSNRYLLEPFFRVRTDALAFFESLGIFEEKEYDEFFESCLGVLITKVTDFALSEISKSEKIKLFEYIHNNDFYNKHLKSVSPPSDVPAFKKTLYKIFKRKNYSLLCFIGKLAKR